MTYITSVERIGLAKGLRQGLLTGLEQILELKFGTEGRPLFEEVKQIDDVALLEAVTERLKTARTPEEVRQVYARSPGEPQGLA